MPSTTTIIITIVTCILSVIASVLMAKRKNRRPMLWGILAFIFSWIALAVLVFLKKKEEPVIRNSKLEEDDEDVKAKWRRTSILQEDEDLGAEVQ